MLHKCNTKPYNVISGFSYLIGLWYVFYSSYIDLFSLALLSTGPLSGAYKPRML